MSGPLIPLAPNELWDCPGLAPSNLRLANSSQQPPKPRLCHTKPASGKYPPNAPTNQVSFRLQEARLGFRHPCEPTLADSAASGALDARSSPRRLPLVGCSGLLGTGFSCTEHVGGEVA